VDAAVPRGGRIRPRSLSSEWTGGGFQSVAGFVSGGDADFMISSKRYRFFPDAIPALVAGIHRTGGADWRSLGAAGVSPLPSLDPGDKPRDDNPDPPDSCLAMGFGQKFNLWQKMAAESVAAFLSSGISAS